MAVLHLLGGVLSLSNAAINTATQITRYCRMVFATEFNPADQSPRRHADRAWIDKSTRPVDPPVKLGHSQLSQSDQTQFLIAQAALQPVRSIDLARPAAQVRPMRQSPFARDSLTEGGGQSQSPPSALENSAADKVVPLYMGSPAVRIRPDASGSALPFPNKSKLPWRLRLLNRVQQGSTVVTGILFTGALIAYASTVYIDKSTGRALVELDALQGESQQLTSANEAIKQSLAEQAAAVDSGLKPYNPGDVLFLSPAPQRETQRETDSVESAPVKMRRPLGY